MKRALALVGLLSLAACSTTPSRAPVIDRLPPAKTADKSAPKPAVKPAVKEPDWRPANYTVQKGDTLYSIALEHGQDYKEVAEWNGIQPPAYTIKIGQVLRMTAPGGESTAPIKPPVVAEAKPLPPAQPAIKTEPKATKQPYSDQALAQLEKPEKVARAEPPKPESPKAEPKPEVAKPTLKRGESAAEDEDEVDWGWPAEGKILANFNDNGNSRGLDLAGSAGQAVLAAASGKVVHTGNTLRGYGKLIIVKHNKRYFSVYAHNSRVLIKEGQSVLKGQKIAEMGDTDADRVKLHFEIRRLGKPVDPLKYLPSDKQS